MHPYPDSPTASSPDGLTVLGLESSCDETAAAVVRLVGDDVLVQSSVVASQAEHALFGGVVPELAARAHVEVMDRVVAQAMGEAGIGFEALDGVAATAGPGLIGGVMVGLMSGKAIAVARKLPLVAVNHLEGHALSPRLTEPVPFPYLLLLVSGGHCQLLWVEGVGQMTRLGTTIDDAVGEAFDKTAKVLGLGYPGGPAVEAASHNGDASRFEFPRPLLGRSLAKHRLDFSFAGLKTALLRAAESLPQRTQQDDADLCASFQVAVAEVLVRKVALAIADCSDRGGHRLVVAGGVAANQLIREELKTLCDDNQWHFHAPPLKYCGDNAAMIALAGAERLRLGKADSLETPARPRWPLDEESARLTPSHAAGKRGVKA